MTNASDESFVRIVRQHAQTARLMGVDFVPSYRVGSGGEGASEASGRAMESVPPASVTPVLAAGYIEAKPFAGTKSVAADTKAVAKQTGTSEAEELLAGVGTGRAAAVGLPGYVRSARQKGEDERAYAARLLDELRARYEQDAPHTQFVTAHTNIVFGDGDPKARLVFIGEAPGEEEDKAGIPFVGRSGQLLNKMIGAMGLSRETVYICNVLKTRPPGNATPTEREAALCEPYLLEQLAIVSPEAIVTLGLPASRLILKTEDTMTRMRGHWASMKLADGRSVPVMPTYHPAYVLRSYTADVRGKVWSDLQMVMDRLGLKGKGGGPA